MSNFLVQKIGGKLVHDFTFELTQAKDFYDWLGKDKTEITFFNTDGALLDDNIFNSIGFPDNFIPVGSVEFVSAYVRKFYPQCVGTLAPLNVPDELMPFAKRVIANVRSEADMEPFKDFDCLLFRKSLKKIKDPDNGMFDPKFSHYLDCQVSEIVDIKSEWRVFVFHNQVQHIANYSGEPLLFPDPVEIGKMVDTYKDHAPAAYTLDVGVGLKEYEDGKRMETFVMEVHRFFSCGLYGFCDHMRIPKMFSQTWYEMKTNKKL